MLISSQYVGYFINDKNVDVKALTAIFFFLYVLASTQDIAVDGWALTLLKPSNVGYSSSCNTVGIEVGKMLGFVVFTTLEAQGILDLSQFLLFWGITFIISTTFICFFVEEKDKATVNELVSENGLSVTEAYKTIWKILRTANVPVFMLVMLTHDFAFSATDSLANLQLVEMGVPRDKIAQLSLPMTFVQILTTLMVTKYTVSSRPMNVFLNAYPFGLLMCLCMTGLVNESDLTSILFSNIYSRST